jgi:hypothetical protein
MLIVEAFHEVIANFCQVSSQPSGLTLRGQRDSRR